MRFWISGPRIGFFRPGVSFGASDFRRSRGGGAPAAQEAPAAFVYVIKGEGERRKIGVSVSPLERLKTLQTGSPYKLGIEYSAPVYGASAFNVEGEAQDILDKLRLEGDWFAVSLNMAIATVYAAADRVGASMRPTGQQSERQDAAPAAESDPFLSERQSRALACVMMAAIVIWIVLLVLHR